jgi:hypothetical protein
MNVVDRESAMFTQGKKPRGKKRQRKQVTSDFDIDNFVEDQFKDVKIDDHSSALWSKNKALVKKFTRMVVAAAGKAGVDDAVVNSTLIALINVGVNIRLAAMPAEFIFCEEPSDQYALWFNKKINYLIKGLGYCDLAQWARKFKEDNLAIDGFKELISFIVDNDLEKEYAADWVSIKLFLMQPELIKKYLDRLENELQAYAAALPEKNKISNRDGLFVLPVDEENPYRRWKILSGYLYEWAQENGFKQAAKILHPLKDWRFIKVLKSLSLMKDVAGMIGSMHGAWSHALQWYFVIEHQKQSGFLQQDPLKLYEFLGSSAPELYGKIWDLVFDQYEGRYFDSPDFLTWALTNPKDRHAWPLLSETVSRYQMKMFDNKNYAYALYKKHKADWKDGVVTRKFKK